MKTSEELLREITDPEDPDTWVIVNATTVGQVEVRALAGDKVASGSSLAEALVNYAALE